MMLKMHMTYMMFWNFMIVFLLCALDTESKPRSRGCTGRSLLPNKPFIVVWNHPSTSCEEKGCHLNFDDWGIVDNRNDKFMGEHISLIYNLGSFPSYHGNITINGGIPQLANETFHLRKTQNDIKTALISHNFSGLAVIDFENWRPIFVLNYDSLNIYQQKSIELAKQRYPTYTKDQILQVATKEFETSARSLLGKTLSLATALRPNGSWGYYGYPRCWDSYCNDSTVKFNDQLKWIYNTSTGLYPSIYFTLNVPANQRAERIKNVVMETLRLKAAWAQPDVQLFPYAFSQDGPYTMFNASDLYYAIRLPADMGASGVVLWGSSDYMRARNECQILQQYLNTVLGPYSLDVSNFFGNCSANNCNGNGRCVKKDLEAHFQQHLRKRKRFECQINKEELKSYDKPFLNNNMNTLKSTSQQRPNVLYENSESSKHFENIWHLKHKAYMHFNIAQFFSETEKPEELKLLEIPTLKTVDDFLVYDYNDYICKCFAGWSGIHCNHQDLKL